VFGFITVTLMMVILSVFATSMIKSENNNTKDKFYYGGQLWNILNLDTLY
jgi:hypothetical protein